jgi:enoyl-CoA hydratase
MPYTHVQVEKHGHVAVLTLDHPPANALSQPTFQGLSAALDEVERDTATKVVVLKGNGRFFAAGADIKEFTAVENAEQGAQISKVGQQLFDRMEAFPKPIIAAIHGAALGGGLELALACHMRLCTPQAKLGLPELNLGLIPGFAGTQRLPQLVGRAKALELMLTSQPITGEEALRYGLVNRLVEDDQLHDEALTVAGHIAAKSAVAIKALLETVYHGMRYGSAEGTRFENERFGACFETEDAREGVAAFLEKRPAQFKDK